MNDIPKEKQKPIKLSLKRLKIKRYKNKYYALNDHKGNLICIAVYKKGAENVKMLIEELYRKSNR